MPIAVLAALVVVGVTLVVLLVRMAFGPGKHALAGKEEALSSLDQDFPDHEAGDVLMAGDSHAALLRMADPAGTFGYVQAFGSKNVTRLFAGPDIRKWQKRGKKGIRIYFNDAGLPMAELEFADETTASAAWQLLEEITA